MISFLLNVAVSLLYGGLVLYYGGPSWAALMTALISFRRGAE